MTSSKSTSSNNPVLVSFPGGLPESLKEDSASSGSKPPSFVWQKTNEKAKSGRRVIGKDRHCLYSASAAGMAYDDRRTKMVVGVYNKATGTLTLRETATRGTVFALQQSVPSYIKEKKHVDSGKGSKDKPNVFEDFGSSKKRKVLKSQAANRVDIDNVVGAGDGSAMVHQIMKGKGMSESNRIAIEEERRSDSTQKTATDKSIEAGRLQLLPAYDAHATKPENVYDARKIAGERAWKKIHGKVYYCLRNENPMEAIVESMYENDWAEFVLKNVQGVDTDAENASFRITCAILVNWMVKFYGGNHKRKSVDGVDEEKARFFGIPTEVAARFFELFMTPIERPGNKASKSFVMSPQNKDKLIVYLLLTFMMAQGSSMKIPNINVIADCLQVPLPHCSLLLKLAGCTVVKKGSVVGATLKAPVSFPDPRRRGPPVRR
ncbi:MAG: hypothetical protein SGILL_002370 [Bacillariaceae sp.]